MPRLEIDLAGAEIISARAIIRKRVEGELPLAAPQTQGWDSDPTTVMALRDRLRRAYEASEDLVRLLPE